MWPKIGKRVQIGASLVAMILPGPVAAEQNAPTASLAEQLKAQYKLAKMGQQDNAPKVLEPGTVLVIQKGGIIPVPFASTTACSARYQDGKIDSPDGLCPEPARKNSASFKVGEKVYPLQINVDLKQEKISFRIVACDSCNGTNPATSFKSEVIFQFAPGFLEHAGVLDVEDTIGDILAVDSSAVAQRPEPMQSQSEVSDPKLLTNEKVIKMTSAKLGDAVILSTIKTSPCNFDTSPDALIKLKQAGVSDAVLQAMVEAAAAPALTPEPATPDTSALSFSTLSQYLTTRWPDRLQSPPQCVSGLLQRLQNAGYRTITDVDTALNNASQELAKRETPQGMSGGVYRPCGLVNATLQATDPRFRAAREGAPTSATSSEPAPQPVPTVEVNCTSYDACIKSGGASLELSKGSEAFAAFQKASQLDPSNAEPWAGMGDAYLQMGQYGDAVGMLDKALQLGATLSFDVMHRKGLSAERGVLRITLSEISFLGPSQEKVFSVGPRDISFHGRGSGSAISPASLLGLRIGGKTYRFYPAPIGLTCPKVSCEGPGLEQQTAIAAYIDDTMTKLAGGSLGKP